MKKLISMFAAVVLLASAVVTSVPASAASGVDVIDTLESYCNEKSGKDFMATMWKPVGCLTADSIHTDSTTSAPNRGDGKSKGNYRSMRVDFDLTETSWGQWRNRTEDNYALIDLINNNEDVYFSFYAKASGNIKIAAEVDVKDVPFYKQVELTTEWKYYKLSLRELVPELPDTAGNMTSIYERNAVKHWGNGTEEAFLIGFKFQVNSNYTGADKGTVWLDTFAFEGPTVSERSSFTTEGGSEYDTTLDKAGVVPKNFKAETTSTTSTTNSTASTNKGTTSKTTSATSSNKTTSSVTSTDATTSIDSTVSDVSSDVDSTDSADVSSEITSSKKATSSKKQTSAGVAEENEGLSTGAKVGIIVGIIVVLAGAGVAVYFFVFKKKKA